jgi:hypothetical protein
LTAETESPRFGGMDMVNLLNQPVDFQITRTTFGTWKRYLYESGMLYREFISHSKVGSMPLVHIAIGRDPRTGKIATAKGFIAIGRKAVGVIAIGQAAAGVIAIGQAATGIVALGQVAVGAFIGIGQLAVGTFALGQAALGVFAFGQGACGVWAAGQFSFGKDLWPLLKRT